MESFDILFNEIFLVEEIDMIPTKINNVITKVKNKIFSKVSRIFAISNSRENQILIDINTEVYKIQEADKLEICIVKFDIFNTFSVNISCVFVWDAEIIIKEKINVITDNTSIPVTIKENILRSILSPNNPNLIEGSK